MALSPVAGVSMDNKDADEDARSLLAEMSSSGFCCTYCDEFFSNDYELQTHCRSDAHQSIIMSDCGGNWTSRPPPRGLVAEQYSLCQRFFTAGTCHFGERCCEAHSEQELAEWKTRFQFRQKKIQQAKDKRLGGNVYSDQLIESWMQASCPQKVMCESLDYVELAVDTDLYVTMSTKRCTKDWTFTLASKVLLHHVALLYDSQQAHFSISSIVGNVVSKLAKSHPVERNCQEWTNPDYVAFVENLDVQYEIKINFTTDIFGTFRQTVVFDFGRPPVLMQRLCVDVVPVTELEKLVETQEIIVSHSARWHEGNKEVVFFYPRTWPMSEEDLSLLHFYEPPHASKLIVTQCVMDKALTKENYVSRMHELLAVEEMARFEQMSRFNVTTKLQLTSAYMLAPSFNCSAKYSVNEELYARMKLTTVLSEDTPAGRLILTNCNSAFIAPVESRNGQHKVYETLIEDKGKNFIYLKISAQCVSELNLKSDEEFHAEIQFQLNRLPLCEMHYAVDKLPSLWLVFPDLHISPSIPWTPQRHWSDKLDSRLNPKQREAIMAITTPSSVRLPPILIVGPYGTGKTFTLAQAIRQIVSQPGNRVLICTHSNSAADLYIREYLHPFVLQGHSENKPLRIYYRNRWVQTVSSVVLKYCLLDEKTQNTNFCLPTAEDVQKHRVIVATLSTSRYLAHLGLRRGFFSHILMDEAAQAMECEAIMPLALADENTRIVLAGDHMQLSPEVHSPFARDRGLHVSLLERLYDSYPARFSCCIMLCENYRSHEAIIHFTSELFYDRQLIAGGKQPSHEVFFPLTFFTARGEDVQEQNSTAFYNNSEVYEIVERVSELVKMWPKAWGKQDENSIGIVSPYADQVFRIRAELRKRRMYSISVERVLNVQGKQFRAIFLSTVRTRHTCIGSDGKDDEVDLGFLSNAKLLNTAITRAQSLVAVVGDPIALCSLGKCRKLWERFIEICQKHKSLYGITWQAIRAQLDGMELKSSYVLNPLAPEFVPNRLRHGDPPTYLTSYMGPHGMVFYQTQHQQPSVANTPACLQSSARHYYVPGMQPHGLPLYSYPLSCLYGISPHYLGAPMMQAPTSYQAANVNSQSGSSKRMPLITNATTPLASPQANDHGNGKVKEVDTLLRRRDRMASDNNLTSGDVKTVAMLRMQPSGSTNKPRTIQEDVRPNGYCVTDTTSYWTNGMPKEVVPNKQFQFLPGVHLPRANSAAVVYSARYAVDPLHKRTSWEPQMDQINRRIYNVGIDDSPESVPVDPNLYKTRQACNSGMPTIEKCSNVVTASSSGRLFERRPSRASISVQPSNAVGGEGGFGDERTNFNRRALVQQSPRDERQAPPDFMWNLVRRANASEEQDRMLESNWPPLKPLPRPLYLRQSNASRVANNSDVYLFSMANTSAPQQLAPSSNSVRPTVVNINNGHQLDASDAISSAALEAESYTNGFPLSYAGALRTHKSAILSKSHLGDAGDVLPSSGLYKHFY